MAETPAEKQAREQREAEDAAAKTIRDLLGGKPAQPGD